MVKTGIKGLVKRIRVKASWVMFLAFLLLISSCKPDVDPVYNPTPYQIKVPKFFPTRMNIPADNPMTVEGVELGRYLFYDGRLSGNTETDKISFGTFLENEKREMFSEDPNKQNLRRCIQQADFVLTNNNSIVDLIRQVSGILENIAISS